MSALTDETIATVKATVPALRAHGSAMVQTFYGLLFERYPSLRRHFNMDRQKGGVSANAGVPAQVAALASAVLTYAKNIDNIPAIMPAVERICNKHVSRGVEASQYDAVGECLLAAMREVLQDAATEQVMAAWTEAYGFLAAAFIETETKIRETLAAAEGGFEGFKEMEVLRVEDAGNAKRLILGVAGGKVPVHAAGQYVGLALDDVEGVGKTMTSVAIDATSTESLSVLVQSGKEKATIHLLTKVSDGDKLIVSMPCGKVPS